MKKYWISSAALLLALFGAGCSAAPKDISASSSKDSRSSSAHPASKSENSAGESLNSSDALSDSAKTSSDLTAHHENETEEKNSIESMASMTPEASEAAKNNPALQAVPLANFEDLKKAFRENGFTLKDENAQGMELSFTAENDSGLVHVQVSRLSNAAMARSDYEQELELLVSEDYQLLDTRSNENFQLASLINDYNSVYGYAGLDQEAGRVYVFEDVLEGNRDACMKIFQALGFSDLHAG